MRNRVIHSLLVTALLTSALGGWLKTAPVAHALGPIICGPYTTNLTNGQVFDWPTAIPVVITSGYNPFPQPTQFRMYDGPANGNEAMAPLYLGDTDGFSYQNFNGALDMEPLPPNTYNVFVQDEEGVWNFCEGSLTITHSPDSTPPTVWVTLSHGGWTNAPYVFYFFNWSDDISGLDYATQQFRWQFNAGAWSAWGSVPVATLEGVSCYQARGRDRAGNPSADSAVVCASIDRTAPIGLSATAAGVTNGVWQNAVVNPTFALTATDSPAGLAAAPYAVCWDTTNTCTPATYQASASYSPGAQTGGAYILRLRAKDNAQNPSAVTSVFTFRYDAAQPAATLSVSGAQGLAGYYRSDVALTAGGSDALSGLAIAETRSQLNAGAWSGWAPTTTLTAEGVYHIEYRAVDLAGNTSGVQTTTLTLDKTAPAITGSQSPLPNGAGWNNTNVSVGFTCSDSLSGVYTNTVAGATVSTEGANQSVTNSGACSDTAGNSATLATVSNIKIDKTAPAISAAQLPLPNGAGWNNTDVTVGFTCSDALSGLSMACPLTQTLTAEGTGLSASGVITDVAGNSNSAAITGIKIDQTAPAIGAAQLPLPNGAGWNNTNVSVGFTCSDALSGLSTACPVTQTLSIEGTSLSASGVITDLAGNSSSASITGIKIDQTAPTATLTVTGELGLNGWYTSSVALSAGGADALSGLSHAPDLRVNGSPWLATTMLTAAGAHTVEHRASDVAGNTRWLTTTEKLDVTAPGAPTGITETHGAQSGVAQSTITAPHFVWSGVSDAASGLAFYRVHFGPDPNGQANESVTDPDYTPASVSAYGVYYLRLQAVDGAGWASAWTTAFVFRYEQTQFLLFLPLVIR